MGDTNTTESITSAASPVAAPRYEHESLICPSCEHEGLRTQYGTYICDSCSAAYSYNYVTAWNKGFRAGISQMLREKQQKDIAEGWTDV